jgi:uncharacterized membrane protein HdeD (DUF308 family)
MCRRALPKSARVSFVNRSGEEESIMENVGRSWGWALLFGVATLIIGILVMAWPEATLRVLTILFGIQLLVTGVYGLVKAFSGELEGKGWAIALGIISIIVAIIVLRNVVETIYILALILGVYWVAHGLIQFVGAVADKKHPARGYTIVMGIISVIAGIIVLSWPVETVTAMAWLLGLWFVVLGILGIILAFVARSEAKKQVAGAA